MYSRKHRLGLCLTLALMCGLHIYNYCLRPPLKAYIGPISVPLKPGVPRISEIDPGGRKSVDSRKSLLKKWLGEVQDKSLIFDPNEVDSVALCAFGIRPYIIRNIMSYRRHGGRFDRCTDLSKIYGIDSMEYEVLLLYCKCKSIMPARQTTPFDINTADSALWVQIRGIGPILASRIIRFRSLLGGFTSVDQLNEVYGLSPGVIEKNRHLFKLESTIQKIDINRSEFPELIAHRYIDYATALAIIKYRKQHGPFDSVGSLQNIISIPDSVYHRIKTYLTTDSIPDN